MGKILKIREVGDPILEKECFAKSCEAYFAMGGNSFVHGCYDEIMKLPTI